MLSPSWLFCLILVRFSEKRSKSARWQSVIMHSALYHWSWTFQPVKISWLPAYLEAIAGMSLITISQRFHSLWQLGLQGDDWTKGIRCLICHHVTFPNGIKCLTRIRIQRCSLQCIESRSFSHTSAPVCDKVRFMYVTCPQFKVLDRCRYRCMWYALYAHSIFKKKVSECLPT